MSERKPIPLAVLKPLADGPWMAEVEAAWDKHQERTRALIGTPAGRIYRG